MALHQRKSMRLPEFDYASPGAYFVTLKTWNREPLFGKVQQEEVDLSEWGNLVHREWQRLESRFPTLQLDAFIVMPDHLHGILCLMEPANPAPISPAPVGAGQESGSRLPPILGAPPPSFHPPAPGSIGAILRSYKSTTTRLINGLRHSSGNPLWQRNYYEHVIRNERKWKRCREYIQANPMHWNQEGEDPEFG